MLNLCLGSFLVSWVWTAVSPEILRARGDKKSHNPTIQRPADPEVADKGRYLSRRSTPKGSSVASDNVDKTSKEFNWRSMPTRKAFGVDCKNAQPTSLPE